MSHEGDAADDETRHSGLEAGLRKGILEPMKYLCLAYEEESKQNRLSRNEWDMDKNHVAKASVTINDPIEEVWDALVNPKTIKQYLFGANVVADWREGSPIVWKGDRKGTSYGDRGVILRFKPTRIL